MSNHARGGRVRKRKAPDRYNAAELHALCVEDYLADVHVRREGSAALAWFAYAIERIARLRGITQDQAFLEIVHDAETQAGRPLL